MSYSSDRPLQSNQLPISIDFPKADDTNFNEVLSLSYKRLVDAVNYKEGGLYTLQEVASFQQYFSITENLSNNRNGYRVTYDLVDLNGGPIGAGATSIPADPIIVGILYPVHGFGAATIAGPIYIFLNDPQVYVRFNNTVPTAQTIDIVNNSGSPLTQAYWTIEYLKN